MISLNQQAWILGSCYGCWFLRPNWHLIALIPCHHFVLAMHYSRQLLQEPCVARICAHVRIIFLCESGRLMHVLLRSASLMHLFVGASAVPSTGILSLLVYVCQASCFMCADLQVQLPSSLISFLTCFPAYQSRFDRAGGRLASIRASAGGSCDGVPRRLDGIFVLNICSSCREEVLGLPSCVCSKSSRRMASCRELLANNRQRIWVAFQAGRLMKSPWMSGTRAAGKSTLPRAVGTLKQAVPDRYDSHLRARE